MTVEDDHKQVVNFYRLVISVRYLTIYKPSSLLWMDKISNTLISCFAVYYNCTNFRLSCICQCLKKKGCCRFLGKNYREKTLFLIELQINIKFRTCRVGKIERFISSALKVNLAKTWTNRVFGASRSCSKSTLLAGGCSIKL